jgi:hypothetical protein
MNCWSIYKDMLYVNKFESIIDKRCKRFSENDYAFDVIGQFVYQTLLNISRNKQAKSVWKSYLISIAL